MTQHHEQDGGDEHKVHDDLLQDVHRASIEQDSPADRFQQLVGQWWNVQVFGHVIAMVQRTGFLKQTLLKVLFVINWAIIEIRNEMRDKNGYFIMLI